MKQIRMKTVDIIKIIIDEKLIDMQFINNELLENVVNTCTIHLLDEQITLNHHQLNILIKDQVAMRTCSNLNQLYIVRFKENKLTVQKIIK